MLSRGVHRALLDILSDKHSPTDKDNLFACVASKKRKRDPLLDALPTSVLHWLQQHAMVKTEWPQRLREWEALTPGRSLVPAVVVRHGDQQVAVAKKKKAGPLDAFFLQDAKEPTKEKAIEAGLSLLFMRTTAMLAGARPFFQLGLPQQPKVDVFSFDLQYKEQTVAKVYAKWTARKTLTYTVDDFKKTTDFVKLEFMLVFVEAKLESYEPEA
jgi:hypothetical protein